jgi:hypothetical protein
MEKNPTAETSEALMKDIEKLKEDLARIAADLKDHAGAHVDATRQLLAERLRVAKEAAAARPLLILGAGFLLGFLFARRLR